MVRRPVNKECQHCGQMIAAEMGEGGHLVWKHVGNLDKYCHPVTGPFYVASPKGR